MTSIDSFARKGNHFYFRPHFIHVDIVKLFLLSNAGQAHCQEHARSPLITDSDHFVLERAALLYVDNGCGGDDGARTRRAIKETSVDLRS